MSECVRERGGERIMCVCSDRFHCLTKGFEAVEGLLMWIDSVEDRK